MLFHIGDSFYENIENGRITTSVIKSFYNTLAIHPKLKKYVIMYENYVIKETAMKDIISKKYQLNKESVVAKILSQYIYLDSEIEAYLMENDIKPICSKGCGACCKDCFSIGISEHFTLKYILIQKGMFEEVKSKAMSQHSTLKAVNIQEWQILESIFSDNNIGDGSNINSSMPCVLLNSDNQCCLYSYRPFICRVFGITYDQPICFKIKRDCKKMFSQDIDEKKIKKHMINKKTIASELISKTIYFPSYDKNVFIKKEAPLLAWLVKDDLFQDSYNSAITEDENIFIGKLSSAKVK